MTEQKEFQLRAGRRGTDGQVRLSNYPPQLLTLGVCYKTDRAVSVVLTAEQARELSASLIDFAVMLEAQTAHAAEAWDGAERRDAGLDARHELAA